MYKPRNLHARLTYSVIIHIRRHCHSHLELFTKHFDMPPNEIELLIRRLDLHKVPHETMARTINFCNEMGFTNDQLLEAPDIFRKNPLNLEQYYKVMTEAGFQNITPATLVKFRTINNKTIDYLKAKHYIPGSADVTNNFIQYLNPRPDDFTVWDTKGDSEKLTDLHRKILEAYLKWRFEASDEEINRIIRIYLLVKNKSLQFLCENIAMAEELGFTREKILKYGYLLHGYPKYTKEVLEKYPSIAGFDMRKAMRMYPKLVSTSPASIERIYKFLKSKNVPDVAIQKRMNIFHLSPETVEQRFAEVEKNSDFNVLITNPNILKIVVHMNRAKSRLNFLKQLHLKCHSVSVLAYDESKFHTHIKEGRDINNVNDTTNFLLGIFDTKEKDFVKTLKLHKFYLQIPLLSMLDTFNFLVGEKFPVDVIKKVVYVLLYPKDKLAFALKKVDEYETKRSVNVSQVMKLHLALYFVEREHHFSGNAVWDRFDVENPALEQ